MFGYRKSNLLNILRPIQRVSLKIRRQRFIFGFVIATVNPLLNPFIVSIFCASTTSVLAQEPIWAVREGLPVGSKAERYLRVLQLAGQTPLHPWSVRGFSPQALVDILPANGGHPWQDRVDFNLEPLKSLGLGWIYPKIELISNSAYPFGENDGSMWVGRGLTAAAEAGGYIRFGRLHIRFAPDGFWTENGYFELANNGESGKAAYRDESVPTGIDRPQRFGDESYGRLNWGSSVLHLALPGVTLGVSGAGQQWGPALHYPLLLGDNAGGFPHVFAQTGAPVDLWAVRLHGRYLLGWPSQSEFSPNLMREHRRVVTGVILALLPKGIDGLELGMARFIHGLYPENSFHREDIFRVFGSVTDDQRGDLNRPDENQMASLFFRWAFPTAGVEVYGELIKEDFARSLRHIIEEPDDFMGRVFGFQKVWSQSQGRLAVIRGEVVNALVHHSERFDRIRFWGNRPMPLYTHSGVGHTQRGQILGSPSAYGGAGWTIGMDLYHTQGRWTVDVSRALQTEFSAIYRGTSGPKISDVIYALKLEAVRFGDGIEWTTSATPSFNLNRNLIEKNDAFNLSLQISMTGLPW